MTGREFLYIEEAHANYHLSGDGKFTKKCNAWLEQHLDCRKALLTHSCTAALEMAAILADIQPGDEVIMPSYTFVSTANAFVLRGGVPVFVDIRRDTLNIDETLIEQAISPRTKAIVPVHYAGVPCEMDDILDIARGHNLLVIEDAAQGIMSSYKGKPLGSIGHMGTLSFHETKNVISGEGGAILINDQRFTDRAEIIRDKGTNRSQFFRGQVDKYTWMDIGSSFLPGEVIAAFLHAQLESAQEITNKRLAAWNRYHLGLESLVIRGVVHRPYIPEDCEFNGHMYYILTQSLEIRTRLIEYLNRCGISAVFHYIPLHSSSAGRRFARFIGDMAVTKLVSDTLLRLPLFVDITEAQQNKVIGAIMNFYSCETDLN